MSLKRKAAAIGIGEVRPFRDPGEETALTLMTKVAAEAIADAGLEKKDIDGVLNGVPFSNPAMFYPAALAEMLGIHPRMLNVVDIGGAIGAAMFWRRPLSTVGCAALCCAWPAI